MCFQVFERDSCIVIYVNRLSVGAGSRFLLFRHFCKTYVRKDYFNNDEHKIQRE